MYALVLLRNNIIVLNERVVSPGHSVLTGMGNVVLPVQSLGCCSTWTLCLDRNERDLSSGSSFLSCPDRSSHSLAEAIIAFFSSIISFYEYNTFYLYIITSTTLH